MPPALAHPAAPRRLHAPATSPRLQPASPSPAAAAPRRAAPCRLAAAAPQAPAQGAAEEGAEEGEWCAPAFVSVDNRKNPHFTVLEVEVQDYPGLMAVVAWVLNGLDTVAQNAVLSTAQDGLAHNTFWLSTRSGKKLSDASADLLADRVRQFLLYCSPKPTDRQQLEFGAGALTASNAEHERYTTVLVRERQRTPGFLLEVASVLGGLNVQVLQGVIQGCTDCGDDVPRLPDGPAPGAAGGAAAGRRVLKFWVLNAEGGKLDPGHVRSLLYSLGVALGMSTQRFPLRPPRRDDL